MALSSQTGSRAFLVVISRTKSDELYILEIFQHPKEITLNRNRSLRLRLGDILRTVQKHVFFLFIFSMFLSQSSDSSTLALLVDPWLSEAMVLFLVRNSSHMGLLRGSACTSTDASMPRKLCPDSLSWGKGFLLMGREGGHGGSPNHPIWEKTEVSGDTELEN